MNTPQPESYEQDKDMQGNEEVINALNAGLTIELTAINQYFICSKMCSDWGLSKLAKHFYDESIEEMKHADEVIDRILFLNGKPEIARYGSIMVGDSPLQQIKDSLMLEADGVNTYNEGIQLCAEVKDAGSRELMDRMVIESEESIDWCETQIDLIEMTGLERYLSQQMGESKG